MIKTLATTSFVPTVPVLPGRAPESGMAVVSDSRGESVPAAEPSPKNVASSGKGSWAGKTMLLGILAAGSVLGPLGLASAQAAQPPHPAPTVQVNQSASAVMARFSDNSFQHGSRPPAASGQANRGTTGNAARTFSFNTRQSAPSSSFSRPTFNSGRQTFPSQNFGRSTAPASRQNVPSQNLGRQGFPTQRQNFPNQEVGRGAFPSGRATQERGGFSQAPRMGQVSRGGHTYNTTVINNNRFESRNRVVNVNNYGRERWGDGWRSNPYGFYAGNAFWSGFLLGEDWSMMTNPYYFMQQPVYVVSPMTGDICGQLQAPGGGAFGNEIGAQLGVLNVMANPQQNPNQPYDPSAGLYLDNGQFDASNPGPKISSQYAYNLLNHGQGIMFHPPNGDFEQLQGLSDLAPYIVTQPAQ